MNSSHTQNIKQKNVALLKDTLRVAQQTNQIAIDTNAELHGQGEKLEGMDTKLTKINVTLGKSQETAKEMNSYWYYLKNKIKRGLGVKMRWQKEEEQQQKKSKTSIEGVRSEFKNQGQVDKKITEMASQDQDQEDQLADQLLNKIKQLKGHSKDMGQQLDRQKSALDKIDAKMDKANTKATKVNTLLNKIMGR